MIKQLLIALCLSMLVACGSSGGDDTPDPTTGVGGGEDGGSGGDGGDNGDDDGDTSGEPDTYALSTQNHLNEADVCVDETGDLSCSEAEYVGQTDNNGMIELPVSSQDFVVIVEAKPHQTIDMQIEQGVGRAYELFALPGSDAATPFSTLAVTESYTLETIAEQWQLPLDMLTSDYFGTEASSDSSMLHAVRALSLFLREELKDDEPLAPYVSPIAVLMDDIVAAANAGESLADLVISKTTDGSVVSNLEQPFIELATEENMAGEWNIYYINQGYGDNVYSDGTIDFSTVTSNYCSYRQDLDSDSAINYDDIPKCRDISFNDGIVNVEQEDSWSLIYGRESAKGTVMIFKVIEHIAGQPPQPNGYVWMDNFEQPIVEGRSIEEAAWKQPLYTLGLNDFEEYDDYTVRINESADEIAFNFGEGRELNYPNTPAIEIAVTDMVNVGGSIQSYAQSETRQDAMMTFRVAQHIALGIHTDPDIHFTLITPNEALIEALETENLVESDEFELVGFE